MKVIKFGGTAFQTPKLVDNVCKIIKEIENSNLKEIIELIEDFDLNKAIGNSEDDNFSHIGSSDELLKK